jgi:sugar lactone lactonase YvrE
MHSSDKTLPLFGLTAMLCAAAFQPDLTPRTYLAATYAGGLPSATSTTATSYPLGPTGSTVVRVTAVATDRFGNVYLSSSLNCVFKVDAAGNLTRVAGTCRPGYSGDGGPALAAQLNAPQGLAADAAGNLYIADRNNHRIRKVSSTGTITTIAGDGSAGFSGDGGPAASAQLNAPRGVAVDPSGNFYIADQNNHRIRAVSPAGIVTTVAGDGSAGFSGDGGPAAGAHLNSPQGVAADSSGNLYIADGGNNRIRKVSNGTIGTVAGGGGPAAGAELSHPQGVAVGTSGNVYIADTGNHRIREVAGGTIATVAGSTPGFSGDRGAAAGAQLHVPEGVAVDSSGNVYVADSANNRVRKLAPGGTISTIAGNGAALFSGDDGPAIAAQLTGPWGITLDPGGNLYFADRYNHRIRKIAPGGAITTVYGGSAGVLAEPAGLASDAVGNLYIGDAGNARVLKVGPGCAPCVVAGIAGSPGYSGDNGPATSARIYSPNALAVDSAGNVYIADSGRLRGARVRKVSPNGIVTTIAGTGAPGHSGDGGPATSAQIASALGLALDSAGNLYIADPDSSTVRKVASDGTIATVAGQSYSRGNSGDGGPARSALLAAPQGLAVDSAGNLFIADEGNGNVRMVSPDGAIQTIAGTGTPGYSGDGGPATGAQLGSPRGLALDAAGNVYVSDSGNNAIRMLQPTGTQPLLSVAAAHDGNFSPGQNGAAYTVTVSNAALALPPSGTVTVTGTLPAGLTATAIGGIGWNCTLATLTCTRSDSLASYPTVTVTVNVAPDAPTQVSNVVTVSGGGSIAANAMDVIDMDVIDMGAIDSPRGRIAETHPPAAIDGSKGGARPSTSVPLQITTTVVPGVTQYQSYYKALSATGGTPPYTWSAPRTQYNVSLPEGMSLDPNTGVISATQVSGQGGYEVTIEVTDSASPTPAAATQILDFGVESDTSFAGCQMFPPDSIYNQRIGQLPLDLNPNHQIPAGYLTFPIHPDFGHGYYPSPGGIPWMRVPANQPLSNVSLAYDGQIDPAGVYQWPLPPWPSAVVEGTSYGGDGSDHHILILQSSTNDINGPQSGACTLYETYQDSDVPSMYDAGSNTWSFAAGAHYNLNGNQIAASTGTLDSGAQDSAGIPMAPLLLRYSEVPLGAQHPLRIAFPNPTNWYVWPGAGCCAGSGPPQGLLYRLKAGVNWQAACPVSVYPQAATVLQALQQYGAYMSDHGGTGYVGGRARSAVGRRRPGVYQDVPRERSGSGRQFAARSIVDQRANQAVRGTGGAPGVRGGRLLQRHDFDGRRQPGVPCVVDFFGLVAAGAFAGGWDHRRHANLVRRQSVYFRHYGDGYRVGI